MTLWLVRAGRHGDQEQGAYENEVVTIGWNDLPDLSNISDKASLGKLFLETYGSEKKMAVANKVDSDKVKEVKDSIENSVKSILKEEFTATPSYKACKFCDYWDICDDKETEES